MGLLLLFSVFLLWLVGITHTRRALCTQLRHAIGTPIAGQLLIADHGKFLGAQSFSGFTLVLGAILVLACRYTKVGFAIMTKV